MNTVAPAPSGVEVDVGRLRRLLREGRHAQALAGAEALLAAWPENRDLMLIAAIASRHLGRIDEALAALARLESAHAGYSRLHEERGLCFVARKDAPDAVEALLKAVNLNPARPMSWRMLEGVYRITGEPEKAATAAEHVAMLRALPPEVVSGTALFFDGDLAAAEQVIRPFLLKHGDHPEAMRLLAKIAMARDVLDDAETLLEAVLAAAPDHRAARSEYAQCLVNRHKYAKASAVIDELRALDPASLEYRTLAATAAVGLGDHARAIAIYDSMLADAPAYAEAHMWLGHALKTVGRLSEAIEAYGAAIAFRPGFGEAYWSLANLKTYRFDAAQIAAMRAAEADPASASDDRAHLCFALGKALEDRGEAAESWTWYARGNASRRAESRYRPEILETNTAEQKRVCTRAFFAARTSWGAAAADPIFIVGLPRSGSTLIEQILASHSQVEGTQELAEAQRIVLDLQGPNPDYDHPRYPAVLETLSAGDCARLGERYLAETAVYRTGRARFIDKMPNNFRHIGLIHLMAPNAVIIDARRDPMSCCFSNLKQLFARGQEFAYGAQDIARYYRTYLELMEHWDEVLPGKVLRVQHEDVVNDLNGAVRRILKHCGLEFEPSCLRFHETARSVRTPSSEQVRRPVFREGLDGWRPYRPWLGELEEALGDALTRYRD